MTNADGTIVKTITDLPGAGHLALTPDGSTLYVALPAADAIATIDLRPAGVTKLSTGDSTCPQELAYAANAVWFGEGCGDQKGSLGVVDPETGTVALGLLGQSPRDTPPNLAADAGHLDGVLFVGRTHERDISRYDVVGGANTADEQHGCEPAHQPQHQDGDPAVGRTRAWCGRQATAISRAAGRRRSTRGHCRFSEASIQA